MPDLPDLLKRSIGEVPPFDLTALATRERRRRRRQVGVGTTMTAVAAAVALVLVLSLGRSDADHGVAIKTRGGSTTEASTTTELPSTMAPTTTPATSTTVTANTNPPPPGGATTTVPAASAPQAGDFTGTLTVDPTTVTVDAGDDARVELTLHNATDHTINVALSSEPTSVGVMCVALGTDGAPARPLTSESNFWFVTAPPLEAGGDDGRSAVFRPTADDVGTVMCEAVVVSSPDGWRTITFVAPVTQIAPVSITVAPPATTTSTAPTTSAPTTT